jgi:hypothetical protein
MQDEVAAILTTLKVAVLMMAMYFLDCLLNFL